MDELLLLPPAARRSGRRPIGVVVSVCMHVMFVLTVMMASTGGSAPSDTEPRQPTSIQWPQLPQSKAMLAEAVSMPVAAPVDYANQAKDARPKADGNTTPTPPKIPEADSPKPEWREYLERALGAVAKGMTAPAYVIDNLSPSLVSMLTDRGLAALIAGTPPFADAEQVVWAGDHAVEVTALPPGWGRDVARRGVPLPVAWTTGVRIRPGDRVYLVPRPALDVAILAAQMREAEDRGVSIEAVVSTRGRFVVESDQTVAFIVDASQIAPTAVRGK